MPINNGYIVLPIMAKIISTLGYFAYCLGSELTLALQMWFGSMQVIDSILVGTMSVLIISQQMQDGKTRGLFQVFKSRLNSYVCRL
jgi:hypothetical protein